MKSRFNKKLSINKRTVANLNVRELRAVKGGVETDPDTTCAGSCPVTCDETGNCPTNNLCTAYSCDLSWCVACLTAFTECDYC